VSGFRDLDDLLAESGGDRPIELPIRGKVYAFPSSISARSGLLLARMAAVAQAEQSGGKAAPDPDLELLSDGEEVDLRAEMMGATEVEMARDGLTTAHTRVVFMTLLTWHLAGEEAALAAWESAGKAPANRATRRARSAAASTTRKRGSTSGTTLVAVKSAPASRGRRSSTTGR
jgi:hypothetical protein